MSKKKNNHEYEKKSSESDIFMLCITIYILNDFDFVPTSNENIEGEDEVGVES
jgi:hypothetical protein